VWLSYWDASFNPDAAPAEEKNDLLQAGSWCFADYLSNRSLECDGKAQRTQRAGIFEQAYWLRDDRHYCESSFFRSRIVPDPPALLSSEVCRTTIRTRNTTCFRECDVCNAFCTNSAARGIKDAIVCTFQLPTLGIVTAARTSDVGVQISYGHGADRRRGRSPTPENAYLEQFDTIVQNDIQNPRVSRQSVSCRKNHREETDGTFVPPLDGNGKPKPRTGFMVPCTTDSDCYSRCGEHPTSGIAYVCTRNPLFYSFHVVNDSLTEETLALALEAQSTSLPAGTDHDSQAYKLAVLEARPRWLPTSDTVSTRAYYVDEPGDDLFDSPSGSGVCTDLR